MSLEPQRYQRLHEIGRGGMGAVYLAQDTVLGRLVAIKQVGLFPGADRSDYERALREARTAASLQHRNVVGIFDLYEEDDRHWLVMEYVESRNLSQYVRDRGALSPAETAHLLTQVVDALAAAHAAGVVHRDVKPGNILIAEDGTAKIADFGLSRRTTEVALTQTGLLSGSPAYLSPEVAEGGSSSPESDVWALGVTAYFMLAGSTPYAGSDTPLTTLFAIVHDAVPRTDRAGWLAPLVAGCMEKDPQRRWSMRRAHDFLVAGPDASADAAHAQAIRDGGEATRIIPGLMPASGALEVTAPAAESRGTREARQRRSGRGAWWVAAAAVLLAVVLVGVKAMNSPTAPASSPSVDAPSTPAHRSAPSPSSHPHTRAVAHTTSASPSPPGTPSPSAKRTRPAKPTHPVPMPMTTTRITSFVYSYVATAPQHPSATWSDLTSGFQRASDGYGGYTGFWGTIQSARAHDISADPSSGEVSYAVDYVKKDGQRMTDSVRLHLVQWRGHILIAGEA